MDDEFSKILTPDALAFLKTLHQEFSNARKNLLAKREERQKQFDAGALPDFLRTSQQFRQIGLECTRSSSRPNGQEGRDNWTCRRQEDGHQRAELRGQRLHGGLRGLAVPRLERGHTGADQRQGRSGPHHLLRVPGGQVLLAQRQGRDALIVRPRGLHLLEKHVLIDGEPVSASLFDFGLFFFHNARNAQGHGQPAPYVYMPKIESQHEATLWDRIFTKSEEYLVLPQGTIRATVLIETLPAAFEMEEILFQLRDHITGSTAGGGTTSSATSRSSGAIPSTSSRTGAQVTMDKAFLAAYVDLLIQTCHKRGVHAIGRDVERTSRSEATSRPNEVAMQKVRADKEREVRLGHDGTWVAHPGLVKLAREVFDAKLNGQAESARRPARGRARHHARTCSGCQKAR